MISFISENIGTIAVGAVVLAVIAVALIRTIGRARRRDCGCGCADCDMADAKKTK